MLFSTMERTNIYRAPSWFVPPRTTMRVDRREGESVDQLIRRFNKGVVSERITKIYRDKMHFISKSEQRKEKRRRAERNRRKKMSKSY
jgi:small subunit ribosomal protein S21